MSFSLNNTTQCINLLIELPLMYNNHKNISHVQLQKIAKDDTENGNVYHDISCILFKITFNIIKFKDKLYSIEN